MKELVLIRHAKSSRDNTELSDFERPLNKRGIEVAPFMANLLLQRFVNPDLIICSSAKRALQTAEFFCNVYDYPIENMMIDKGIYERGSKYIINLLSIIDNSISSIILIGHNPDISFLSSYFGGEHIAETPTCGMIGLSFNIDYWKDIPNSNGEIQFVEFPRNYFKNELS